MELNEIIRSNNFCTVHLLHWITELRSRQSKHLVGYVLRTYLYMQCENRQSKHLVGYVLRTYLYMQCENVINVISHVTCSVFLEQ